MPDCTFVTNIYEKTYRTVLVPGNLQSIIAQHQYPFSERILTINNVNNRQDAERLANEAIARKEIDRYEFVENHIIEALKIAHMRQKDLGRIPYYSNCIIVALYITKTPYIMYQDVEVELVGQGANWIDRGIKELELNPHAFVVDPIHEHTVHVFQRDALAYYKEYIVSYGFSDLMFLTHTSILQKPFYRGMHLASRRYPIAGIHPIFEQWMDSFMRKYHLLRLTDRTVMLKHDGPGESQDTPHKLPERFRRKFNVLISPYATKVSNRRARKYVKQLLPHVSQSWLKHDEMTTIQHH